MDILEEGSDWLYDTLQATASQPIVYSRGTSSCAVQATIGRTEFQIDDGAELLQRIESRDYLIPVASLVLDDARTIPQRGDRITEGGCLYEVLAPGKEPVWRFSDAYRRTYRIHTKRIG